MVRGEASPIAEPIDQNGRTCNCFINYQFLREPLLIFIELYITEQSGPVIPSHSMSLALIESLREGSFIFVTKTSDQTRQGDTLSLYSFYSSP